MIRLIMIRTVRTSEKEESHEKVVHEGNIRVSFHFHGAHGNGRYAPKERRT